jgi:glutamyl-tRNA reductase
VFLYTIDDLQQVIDNNINNRQKEKTLAEEIVVIQLLVFWNAEWISENITLKELYPIIVAIEVWGYRIANKSICFNCDNEALV